MNLLNTLLEPQTQKGYRIYGVVIGIVTNNQDKQNLGRVQVRFPWLDDQNTSNWARIASPMAGADRGIYFLPEIDDEVLVVFEQGDVRFPYVLGVLWNGKDKPPATNEDGKNNIRLIKSRSGHLIRLDDTNGAEKIEIIDKSGENQIVFDTSNNAIAITATQDITLSARNITLSAQQGTLKLEANSIELDASSTIQMQAKAQLNAEANGVMTLKGKPINLN
ncbi:MAG: phage tail protein [Cyanobacteria bacterium CRU_2_1]|nr:phage tail protein [Cyanobacteria bacterium RU_5_0]NJR57845.1 phage tail protein [Cyanobacteria bacterium CRU_2_1]